MVQTLKFTLSLDLDQPAGHKLGKQGMCRELEKARVRDTEITSGRGENIV